MQAGWSRYAGSSQKNGTWPGVVHWFSEDPKETQYDYVLRFDKALPAGEYQVFIHQFYPGKQSVIRDGQEKPATIIRRRYGWSYPIRFMVKEPAKQLTVRYYRSRPDKHGYILLAVYVTSNLDEQLVGNPISSDIFSDTAAEGEDRKAENHTYPTGNYLPNSSFECGVGHGYGKRDGTFWSSESWTTRQRKTESTP